MSDSSDRSQRLRDDESRSSDGSRAAGSITNYFAPDEDEEVPVETLIDSVPDILAICNPVGLCESLTITRCPRVTYVTTQVNDNSLLTCVSERPPPR